MAAALTFEEYKTRANLVHGGLYEYISLGKTHVTLVCPDHGEQKKRKHDHLNGGGCSKCGIAARGVKPSIDSFGDRARVVHGDKYTYLKLTADDKVIYSCPTHGKVEQSRGNHIQGHGCPKCGRRKEAHAAKIFPEIVAKLEKIHSSKYHYKELAGGYMLYTCPTHGDCIQKYADLLRGYGCKDCGNERSAAERTGSLAEYLSKVPESVKLGLTYLEVDTANVMFSCAKHGVQVQQKYSHRVGLGCPRCSAGKQVSRFSTELSAWLASLNIAHDMESKTPYKSSSLTADILIGKLILELNGDYWHTEDKVGKTRHIDKYTLAVKHGYDFMMFSDNEWASKQEIIKSAILSRLGLRTTAKVMARKLNAVKIAASQARPILEANHIQGFAAAQTWLGLKDGNELVAVAGFSMKETGRGKRSSETSCELVRYCTSKSVVGGLSKLIAKARKLLQFSRLNTFSDDRFFNGNIYEKLGFTAARKIPPSYYYVKSGVVINKASLQKSAFALRQDLLFDKDLTEAELAELNGYKRSYDAGKTLWVLDVK